VPEPEKPAVKAPRPKKAAEPKVETPEPAKPAEPAPVAQDKPTIHAQPGLNTGYNVAGVQEKPIRKIIDEWDAALDAGKITADRYNEMANACNAIADNRAVMQFIVKYRKVE
jgi:hypothetical protein